MADTSIRPYRVAIAQADLDDLAARLANVRWPDELPGVGGAYGMTTARVRHLTEYWRDTFDWRALEARLNAYPQFVTEIDGEQIHFLHVRSARADATPLILTHGWPGSVVEYLNVIEPLTAPADPDAPAFHLVIPSMPGYGFSGPTRSAGWHRWRIAAAWRTLMARLGYERYGAVGNDAGSMISPELGRLDGEHVIGVHVTQVFSFPSGDPAEFEKFTPTDYAALQHLQWFYENKFSFNTVQSQQPQTLAFALADSPVGLLAWNAQLMGESLDDEFVVSNVAIYWLTRTGGSSIRLYYEDAQHTPETDGPTTVPLGVAMFAGDFQSMRPLADRDHANIVSWNSYGTENPDEVGGHYAAHEFPDVLSRDIRTFFAML
ncbi:epoxide hydrolase family protein [Luedemannella helvata]|uniref:Epoxide hydrolase N-terminal domain-containing protein n=1 Tax=Luedemannella helvata TaxID=349315 RepID=A0ABP4WKA2_9ACTN